MTTTQPFTPTHIIFVPGRSTPVLLDEGRCYTAAEWDACEHADWTYDDDGGGLLRLGQAVDGSSIEAVPCPPPRLTIEEEAALVVEAFAADDGRAGINCGGLWVGWGGSRTRIRPEWLLVLDTDELSSMAGHEILCADVDAEAIRWMHELSLDSAAEWEFLELTIDHSELTSDAEAIRAPLLAALARAALATASWVGDGQDPDTGSIPCGLRAADGPLAGRDLAGCVVQRDGRIDVRSDGCGAFFGLTVDEIDWPDYADALEASDTPADDREARKAPTTTQED